MESSAFNHAAWNPLHSIGMQFTTLNGVHCIQSRCMESPAFNRDALGHAAKKSTAFNRDALGLAAWTPLHKIGIQCATMHGIHCIQSGCFGPCCIKSTAFNRDALCLTAWTPLHTIGIHCATMHGIHCIQSGCILISCMESIQSSRCMDSAAYSRDPLRHNAWNPRIH